MPTGKPQKPTHCLLCGQRFRRRVSHQHFCSTGCKLFASIDFSPGQGPCGDCWFWLKSLRHGGYGQINDDGQIRRAHHVSYEMLVGPIPEGKQLNHTCDTPHCVNPKHLYTGTQKDNAADLWARGNPKPPPRNDLRGERARQAKLSDHAVRWIRWLYKAQVGGFATQRRLARAFGVNPSQISRAISGERWGHV